MKSYDRQQPKRIVCHLSRNDQQQFKRTASSPLWSTIDRARGRQPRRACAATPLSGSDSCTVDYNTPPEGQATFPRDLSPDPNSCWRALPGSATTDAESRTPAVHSDPQSARSQCPSPESRQSIANSMRFPSNGFTYYLTFFSKFFSSFPHGTCSLSVSCQYSALDGVYHPFWAAFPNNPTHGKRIVNGTRCRKRDCHPLWCAIPSNLSTK